jgi:hypothetical protein
MSLAALTAALRSVVRWSGRGVAAPPSSLSLFDDLQNILRLAAQCPSGRAGDDIRRAACELVEATSVTAHGTSRSRILKVIAGVEQRRARGRSRDDDPHPSTLAALVEALHAFAPKPSSRG